MKLKLQYAKTVYDNNIAATFENFKTHNGLFILKLIYKFLFCFKNSAGLTFTKLLSVKFISKIFTAH